MQPQIPVTNELLFAQLLLKLNHLGYVFVHNKDIDEPDVESYSLLGNDNVFLNTCDGFIDLYVYCKQKMFKRITDTTAEELISHLD